MFERIIVLLLISFLVASCSDNNSSSESTTETLILLSKKVPCFGVSQRLCNVALNTDGIEELFFDPVNGFGFMWGHSYKLLVNVSNVDDPPEDGSTLKYDLKEINSNIEDSIGTGYRYELVELLNNTFTSEGDVYYFLGQPFECSNSIDCNGLISLNNSGGLVNVTFNYLGDGKIMLNQWD